MANNTIEKQPKFKIGEVVKVERQGNYRYFVINTIETCRDTYIYNDYLEKYLFALDLEETLTYNQKVSEYKQEIIDYITEKVLISYSGEEDPVKTDVVMNIVKIVNQD